MAKEKTEKELLTEISKKLDKIVAVLTIQNINDRDEKIAILKKFGLESPEIALLFGLTDRAVRYTKGWKRK